MEDQVTEMGTEECWEFLRRHEFGRLAHHLADEVHIAPVNYAVDHDPASDRRSLLFRTAEGSKLLGVVMNPDVAFEVDEVVGEQATSVIVRGRARRLEEDEEHRAENVPLRGCRHRSGTSWRSTSPGSAADASSCPVRGGT
jgi:uncharacterized protein